MGRQDEEIQRKLSELEESLSQEGPGELSTRSSGSELASAHKLKEEIELYTGAGSLRADLYYISGFGMILASLLMFFNHMKVGTSIFTALGFGQEGFGLVLIPLLIGLGINIYNFKSRVGWVITSASCALIIFAVLSHVIMTFPKISFLGLILMLLPLAAGGALIRKGLETRSPEQGGKA